MKQILTIFPLLTVPVFLYNCIAIATASPSDTVPMPINAALDAQIFSLGMISGGSWTFSLGHALLLLALITLFVELIKATNTGSASLMNHGVSMALLLFCFMEFLLLRNFATSVFFLLTIAILLDVIAGFMITIVAARRDFGIGESLT